MRVTVLHDGKELSGKVIYNFKMISDVIMVRFDYPFDGVDRDVLLCWNSDKKKWEDTSNMANKFPHIFEQLRFKLRNVFKEASGDNRLAEMQDA